MYRFGWFSTGRDAAAGDLLRTVQESIARSQINGEIAFVFSNREPGESSESDKFFELVRSYNIPLITHSSRRFRERWAAKGEVPANWRILFDREVMAKLAGREMPLCVLAGYMLIMGAEICRRYPMINLHPAAPGGPAGTWQEVIWQLIAEKARESGVMMNAVIPELDKGPAATYCTYSIRGEPFDKYWAEADGLAIEEIKARWGEQLPLFQLIRRYGLAREFPLIVATLKAFAQGKVVLQNGLVIGSDGKPVPPLDLTPEIDRQVEGKLAL